MSPVLDSFSSSTSQWAKVVAILLLVAVGCLAQSCTRETCPEGPIEAFFLTNDCSDLPTFFRHVPNTPYGQCSRVTDGVWVLPELTDLGEQSITTDNDMCDITLSNATYTKVLDLYGACRPIGGPRKDEMASYSKSILLSNVNATFTSPQVTSVNSTYPNFFDEVTSQSCYAPDNCTYQGQPAMFWSTYNNDTCYPQSSTGTYNMSLDGSCYRFNLAYYMSFACVDQNTVASTQFIGEGCQHPYSVNVERKVCNSRHSETTYCMVPPLSPDSPIVPGVHTPDSTPSSTPSSTPAATPSSSSRLIPTSLLVIVLGALLF